MNPMKSPICSRETRSRFSALNDLISVLNQDEENFRDSRQEGTQVQIQERVGGSRLSLGGLMVQTRCVDGRGRKSTFSGLSSHTFTSLQNRIFSSVILVHLDQYGDFHHCEKISHVGALLL